MRKIAAVVGVLSLFSLIHLVRAGGDDARVRDLVARAVKAHGGAENLAKWKASTLKIKGKLLGLDYLAQISIRLPDHIRNEAQSQLGKSLQIVSGDHGWVKVGDVTQDCSREDVTETRELLHAIAVSHLTALSEQEYKLTLAGEETIEGRPAVGVRVERAGFRDVTLFFDKETDRLVKSQTRLKNPQGGAEVAAETFYGDYRNVNGVMAAHKLTIKYDGKVFNDADITEVKLADKLDDNLFEKP